MYYSWLWLTLVSGVFLGFYDIFKKKALERDSLFKVLALYSFFSFLLVSFEFNNALNISKYSLLLILVKSMIIFLSWILGFIAIKNMPISVITPFGTLSPVFTIILGIMVLGEHLKLIQAVGIAVVLISYYFVGKVGAMEVKGLFRNKYLYLMVISMMLSATSALVDKIALKGVNTGQLQFWFSLFLSALYVSTFFINRFVVRNNPNANIEHNENNLTAKGIITCIPYFIILMSLFLVISDRIYFHAVQMHGSQISVILPLRKISILVSAIIGGIIFKEKNLKAKFLSMCLLAVGIIMIFIGK